MTLTATVPIGPFSIAVAFAGRSGTSGLVGAVTSDKSAIFGLLGPGARAGVAGVEGVAGPAAIGVKNGVWGFAAGLMENSDDGPGGAEGLPSPKSVDLAAFSSGIVRAATGVVMADGVDGTVNGWVEKRDFVVSAGFCPNRLNPLVPAGFVDSVDGRDLLGSILGWPNIPNVTVEGFCPAGSAASAGFCPRGLMAGAGGLALSAGF